MNGLLAKAIELAFDVLFPKAADWVALLVAALFSSSLDFVEEAQEWDDATGPEKGEAVRGSVEKYLDEAFDHIPEWSELSEAKRDRIIVGNSELVLFIIETADGDGVDLKATRKKLRKARRKLRRSS